ncbi:InlB B-repeat-containing protein, partial [Candidatus Bathycorpusculum sp.]|uniref:InlB B-repeat-containing protein n=1 Tax=Candidatus Bathycorpusculum sp. TaxID=2994959 RepID=UPI0028353C78|nr:InlB B-repeat-containing protein [Candidatus Termitimicrobium sp.]MCL2686049.1 InlB B-repeat-containing protein [Candidatus Termitimicrobium sp.]
FGTVVSVSAIDIDGYTVVAPSSVNVTIGVSGTEVVFFYTANTYTITYDPNGGAGVMPDTDATYDMDVTLSNNAFTRDDYLFIGWNTQADGLGFAYSNGTTFNYLYALDLTLYAVWLEKGGVSKTVTGGSSSFAVGDSVTYEIKYTLPRVVSTIAVFKVVDSWTAGLEYMGCALTINGVPVSSVSVDSTTVAGQVIVTLDPADLVGDGVVVLLVTFQVVGADSGISNTAEVIIDGETIGTETEDLFKVTYNANYPSGAIGSSGSVPVDDNLYKFGAIVTVVGNTGDLAVDGWSFLNWQVGSSSYVAGSSFVITVNTELYAQWIEVSYAISYVLDGGVNAHSNPPEYIVTELPVKISNPSRTDYSFVGWIVQYADGSTVLSSSNYVIPEGTTGDLQLTARWSSIGVEPIIWYTVRYYANWPNGDAGTGSAPVDDRSPYMIGKAVTVLDQGTLDNEGYIFLGWAATPEADQPTYLSGSTFAIQANAVLYAVWQSSGESLSVSYVVHYYLQNSTTSIIDSKIVMGQTMGALVSEVAVSVSGYTAVVPTSVSVVLTATDNVIIFYYTTNSGGGNTNGGGSGSSSSNKPFSAILPTHLPTEPTPLPTETPTEPPHELTETWALTNLILSITGLILAIILTAWVLLQKKYKSEQKTNIKNQQNTTERQEEKQQKYLTLWLLTSIVIGIAGIIVFLLTENTNLPMGMIDKWSIVSATLFTVELIAITFTFKCKKDFSDD